MQLSRAARVVVLLLLLSPVLFAAEDLTGKWSGPFVITADGNPPQENSAQMVAKQTGAELTGSIGPTAEQQWPIAKGKIATVKEDGKDVTKITFEVQAGEGGPIIQFAMTLADGHLKGSAKAEQDGHILSAAVDLARVK